MDKIYRALEQLDPKEQEMIRAHFLSDEGDESTYEELGSQLGVSKASAYRIEKAALKKLGALVAPEFN